MAIQLMLEDHTGNRRFEVKIEEAVQIAQLIPAIITTLGLPVTDPAGRPISYRLSHRNRRLQENETLEDADVHSGDTITIVPDMTAGSQSQPDSTTQSPLPPLVVLESIVHKQQPTIGFPQEYHVAFQSGTVQVSLSPDTMHLVRVQAKAHPDQEVGGILLGSVYEQDGWFLVNVEKILEAEHTLAGLTFVTFTDQTWLDLLKQRHGYPALYVVGWYHSHPGFGIFLSTSDEFIHRSFFGNQPWYVTLVVDPSTDACGVFAWENGEIKRCSEK